LKKILPHKAKRGLRGLRYSGWVGVGQLCEKCGRKRAVFRAAFLGKAYCEACYLAELELKVKRNVSKLRLKEVASNVFVPFHPMFPLSSLLLHKIVEKIERKFSKKPLLLALSCHADLARGIVGEDSVMVVNADRPLFEELKERKERGIAWAWRFLRGVFALSVREFERAILVMPGCSDFLAFLDLLAFLLGEEKSHENSPVLSPPDDEGPGIVNGFYGVPCSEVAIVSYSLLGDPGLPGEPALLSKVESVIYRMLQDSIGGRSYESLINLEKAFLLISSAGGYRRCRFCRGASSGEVCAYCRGLEKHSGAIRAARPVTPSSCQT